MRSFIFYTPPQILFGKSNQGECGWAGHVARMGEECVQGFDGKDGRDHLEDQGLDGRMRSEWILGRLAGGV
jgi:hypothetical protein